MVIYILERPASGPARRITASDLFQFLSTPNIKQQITTQLAAEDILQKTGFTPEQLKVYLENPPAGKIPLTDNKDCYYPMVLSVTDSL